MELDNDLQERKDLLYELVAEVVEDLALGNAIKEADAEGMTSEEDLARALRGEA